MSLRWGVVGALVWVGLMVGTAFDSAQASINRGVSVYPERGRRGVVGAASHSEISPTPEPELPREWLVAQNAEPSAAQQLFDEGYALFEAGTAESLQAAIAKFKAVLSLQQGTVPPATQGLSHYLAGFAYFRLGFNQDALKHYEPALVIFNSLTEETVGENLQNAQTLQASTLVGIGAVYDALGEKQQALEFYNQALPLFQALGDRTREATTVTSIGVIYSTLGDKQQALEFYNRALLILQTIEDSETSRQVQAEEARILNNMGWIYYELGDTEQALEFYNQALVFFQSVGDRSSEAITLDSIGGVYSSLGDKQQALELYHQALSLRQAVGDRSGEATTLSNIGGVYRDLGDKQQALKFFQQALSLAQSTGNRGVEVRVLINIAAVYAALGEQQKLVEFYEQVLPLLQAVGDRAGEANIRNQMGQIFAARGEYKQALDFYDQSLILTQAVGDRSGEAITLYNIAFTQYLQGQRTAALPNIQAAIQLIEQLRAAAPPGELRQSYFATVQDYYQFYLDLLMELHEQDPNGGYDTQAFQVSESSRARILIEQLTEANIDIRQGVDPTLLRQEQDLIQKLNAAEQRRINLLNSGAASDNQIAQQIATLENLLNDIATVESRIRQTSPTYAQLKFPEPLSLSEIQDQVLDEETLLLEYALGAEKSYLFLVSKTGLTTVELPPQAEIEQAVEEYREKLQTPTFTDLSQGQALSEMLLGQVADQLGDKRLVIVSNGKLQLLPFGALPVPGASVAPLLQNHEIIALPSATSLAVQRGQWQNRPAAPKTIALFADPVFEANDDRFAANVKPDAPLSQDLSDLVSFDERTGCTQFRRLPYTATEAENILNLVPDDEEFQAMGFAADHEAATDEQLKDYQVLHLATHGCIQDDARLSGLALSVYEPDGDQARNQLLKLQDIYNLELNAELVVLSACQTGVGTEIAGEGVVGLTSGFLYAGAKRVVVSLWNVSDRGTADLMSDYYARMWEQEQEPGAALREAQLAAWESGTKYQAPYYWAAFTMQGEF